MKKSLMDTLRAYNAIYENATAGAVHGTAVNEGSFSRNVEIFDRACDVIRIPEDAVEAYSGGVEYLVDVTGGKVGGEFDNRTYHYLLDWLPRNEYGRTIFALEAGLDETELSVACLVMAVSDEGEYLVGLVKREFPEDSELTPEEISAAMSSAETKANAVLAAIPGDAVSKPDRFEDYWTGLKTVPRK